MHNFFLHFSLLDKHDGEYFTSLLCKYRYSNTSLNKKTDKVKEGPTESYNTIVFDVLYNVLNKC